MARTILHVDLDAFFVGVELVKDPSLRGRPVVVGGLPGQRGVVASASYEARAYGLRSGMSLSQAQRLCPQAVYLPGDFHRYAAASDAFMDILAAFSPLVEPASLDEAYLDLTGSEASLGPAAQTAEAIRRRVREELSLTASVGIASGKVVAKVASEEAKPDGVREVPAGGEAAFLAPLPVRRLPGVGPHVAAVLGRVSVETIGDLARLPQDVARRLPGAAGAHLARAACGEDPSPVRAPRPAKSISRETTFARDTHDHSLLEDTVVYFADRVGAALRREGRVASTVTLKLRYGDFSTITRNRTVAAPTDDELDIANASVDLLRAALEQRGDPVRLVGVGVAGLAAPARQIGLFEPSVARRQALHEVVDRLRRRYGDSVVVSGRALRLDEVHEDRREGYTLRPPGLSR